MKRRLLIDTQIARLKLIYVGISTFNGIQYKIHEIFHREIGRYRNFSFTSTKSNEQAIFHFKNCKSIFFTSFLFLNKFSEALSVYDIFMVFRKTFFWKLRDRIVRIETIECIDVSNEKNNIVRTCSCGPRINFCKDCKIDCLAMRI